MRSIRRNNRRDHARGNCGKHVIPIYLAPLISSRRPAKAILPVVNPLPAVPILMPHVVALPPLPVLHIMVVIAIAMVAIVVVMVILRKHRSAREHGDHGRICNYVANGFHVTPLYIQVFLPPGLSCPQVHRWHWNEDGFWASLGCIKFDRVGAFYLSHPSDHHSPIHSAKNPANGSQIHNLLQRSAL